MADETTRCHQPATEEGSDADKILLAAAHALVRALAEAKQGRMTAAQVRDALAAAETFEQATSDLRSGSSIFAEALERMSWAERKRPKWSAPYEPSPAQAGWPDRAMIADVMRKHNIDPNAEDEPGRTRVEQVRSKLRIASLFGEMSDTAPSSVEWRRALEDMARRLKEARDHAPQWAYEELLRELADRKWGGCADEIDVENLMAMLIATATGLKDRRPHPATRSPGRPRKGGSLSAEVALAIEELWRKWKGTGSIEHRDGREPSPATRFFQELAMAVGLPSDVPRGSLRGNSARKKAN